MENLLASDELVSFSAAKVEKTQAGVAFQGTIETAIALVSGLGLPTGSASAWNFRCAESRKNFMAA
jgi:hypothetical protein